MSKMLKCNVGVAVLLLALGALVGPSIAQSQAPTDGLVAHWAFDETEGETAADGSGNGHDGLLLGAPVWVEQGKVGGALQFDGEDDVMQVPHTPDFDLVNGVTLMGWVFADEAPDVGPGNDWRLILGRSGFSPYGLLLEQDGRLSGSVRIGGERQLLLSTSQLPIGEWVHVVYSYNALNGIARIYLNGQLDAEAVLARGSIDVTENLVRVSLGNNADLQENHVWKGMFDELRVYARDLREEEVASVFDAER